ncbi:WD domain, G-beta repeat-containing protein [Besnoitia besnoiti]|uniref:WD domain, G-beta repeat-containing protein n=1 Tax=Besnoitia besnoiti TaxID=94643 RepID=A0A2A9MNA8_BESBE|nr:WD domain, G-beta repeat-containing protein [Besnoitia besnoiti]PFH37122.1 WD domain, G-beta repeat-containing protein [Besnoitia besnoiti]
MGELSTTWQPRLLLQSFCSNAATVSSLNLASSPSLSSSVQAENSQLLFSLNGGSLFAVPLDAAIGASERRAAEPRSRKTEDADAAQDGARDDPLASAPSPVFLRHPVAAPQQLINEEIAEGIAAFATCNLSPSASQTSHPSSLFARGEAASEREGLLVTAGASTGLLRCFRVHVQPQRAIAPADDEDEETAEESRGLQLLRSMQQRAAGGDGQDNESPLCLNGENGAGAWLKMEELIKWRGSRGVARLLALSQPFEPPFLLSRGRKAVCRCLAVGYADGAVECHLFLFFFGRAARPAAAEQGDNADSKDAKGAESQGDEIRLVSMQVVQRCFAEQFNGEAVNALRFHPSRLLLAVGGERGRLQLVDLAPAVFSSLASLTGRAPADAPRRRSVYALSDHMSAINSLAFAAAFEGAKKKAKPFGRERETDGTAQPQALGVLVSAGGDKLVNFWNLEESLSSSAGDLETLAFELGGRRGEGKKKGSRLADWEERANAPSELTPSLQLPTSELITAMVYVHTKTADVRAKKREDKCDDADEERGLLFVGGEEGNLLVFSLKQRKFIKTVPLPTRSAAAVASSLPGHSSSSRGRQVSEDLNAVVRSLTLVQREARLHLMVAQESGVISLFPLAAFFSQGTLASSSLPSRSKPSFFVGRMEGILASRFLPQPPAGCRCPCCSLRRAAPQVEGERGKRKREEQEGAAIEDEDTSDAARASSAFPRSLVALVGERQPWLLRLDDVSGAGRPIGWGDADGDCAGSKSPAALVEAHEAPAACCDVSRKGCWVVSGASDGSIAVWHVASGRLLARVPSGHHGGAINAVALQQKEWVRASPLFKKPQEGACSSEDASASPSRKASKARSAASPSATSGAGWAGMLCSCDCRGINSSTPHSLIFAAASSGDHAVKLWRAEITPGFLLNEKQYAFEGKPGKAKNKEREAAGAAPQVLVTSLASVVAHRKEINDIKISPNDSLLCTVSQDKTGKLFSFPSLAYIGELRGHTRSIFACAFPKREKLVATASADATVKLWNVNTLACIKTFQSTVGGGILALSFLSRDTQLVTGTSEGLLELWNCRTAECVGTLPAVHEENKIWCLDVCAPAMVTGGSGGLLCLWEDITKLTRRKAQVAQLRETQQLAALKLLAAEGRGTEVFSLLLRLRRKAGMREFLEGHFGKILLRAFQRGLDLQRQLSLASSSSLKPGSLFGADLDSSPATFHRFASFLDSLEAEAESPEGADRRGKKGRRAGGAAQNEASRAKWTAGESLRGAFLRDLDGELSLLDLLRTLKKKDIKTLLQFATDWNSDSHTAWLGQGLMNLLLEVRGAEAIFGGDKDRKRQEELENFVGSFCAYTARHERRLNALIEKSFLLDLLQGCEGDGGLGYDVRRKTKGELGHEYAKEEVRSAAEATAFTRLCLYGEDEAKTETKEKGKKTLEAEDDADTQSAEDEEEVDESEEEEDEEEQGDSEDGEGDSEAEDEAAEDVEDDSEAD